MYQKYKNAEIVKPGGLELKDRLVGVQRVTKVTKGGRAFGFSAIVVVDFRRVFREGVKFQVQGLTQNSNQVCPYLLEISNTRLLPLTHHF